MKFSRGFTLIELIFSMVIIAIAFSVLPKILQLSTKVSSQNVREEAMYNAVALAGLISSNAWDENNTIVDDILLVSTDGDKAYECNQTTDLRVGGFVGSRNCKNDYTASTIGVDGADNGVKNDVDDFDKDEISSINYNSSRDYNLSVSVNYVKDISNSNNPFTFSNDIKNNSTNTKYIKIEVLPNKKAEVLRKTIAKFDFYMFNLGQITINKRAWQ